MLIEGEQPASAVLLGENHKRKISQTQVQVSIAIVELQRHGMVLGGEALHAEPVLGQILEEAATRRAPTSPPDQVVDLCRYRSGYDQPASFRLEGSQDGIAAGLAEVTDGDDGGGIDDQGQ